MMMTRHSWTVPVHAAGRSRTSSCAVFETAAFAVSPLRPGRLVLCAGFEPALPFGNGHLKPVRMPSSASRACCISLFFASFFAPSRLCGSLRTPHSRTRRGKGSNLHPPASEAGAESASASATTSLNAPSRIRTCTHQEELLRLPRLPIPPSGRYLFALNTQHAA